MSEVPLSVGKFKVNHNCFRESIQLELSSILLQNMSEDELNYFCQLMEHFNSFMYGFALISVVLCFTLSLLSNIALAKKTQSEAFTTSYRQSTISNADFAVLVPP